MKSMKDVKLNEAKIVGEHRENADIVVSPYPSDHRAVVVTFSVPKHKDILAPDLGGYEQP